MYQRAALAGVIMAGLGVLCLPAGGAEPKAKAEGHKQGGLQRMTFGKTPEGTPVELYVLTNGNG